MNQSKVKRLRKELRNRMGITKEQANTAEYADVKRKVLVTGEGGEPLTVLKLQSVLAEGQFKYKMKQAKRAWSTLNTPEKQAKVRVSNVS